MGLFDWGGHDDTDDVFDFIAAREIIGSSKTCRGTDEKNCENCAYRYDFIMCNAPFSRNRSKCCSDWKEG